MTAKSWESLETDEPLTGPSSVARPPVPRKVIPAWLLSMGVHVLLLVALALVLQRNYRGAEAEASRSGGIVLVKLSSETTEYLSEGDTDNQASAVQPASSPPPLPDLAQRPVDLPGPTTSVQTESGIGEALIASLPSTGELTAGSSTGGRVGGETTTEVFGVRGTGSEFVYVFDRSASMEGYEARPLRAAKQQLLASLESLGSNQQFQMVFYNEETRVFSPAPGPPTMMFATPETKLKAARFVEGMRGSGGTDHLNALKFALRLAPDVIFMLTDAEGGFSKAELAQIANWNRGGTVINAIEFGDGPQRSGGDRSLEELARQSRGQYLYKNIQTLRD